MTVASEETAETLEGAAARVVRLAKERGLTLATVESCTAGALATLLAEAPGAADTFHGGFIVYTKANKSAAVGVPPALIEKHTAVSAAVAQAMARGGLDRCPADIVVAITGVAGPEPDEDGNPVGLVHIALACRDGTVRHVERRFGEQPKKRICSAALRAALALLDDTIGPGWDDTKTGRSCR